MGTTLKISLLFIVIMSQLSISQSIRDMNNKVNQSSSRSRTQYRDYKEQGGYNTSVHILGSERKFERVRFRPRMLKAWHQLFISAKSYGIISDLRDSGYVNTNGTLNDNVVDLDVPLTPRKVINENEVKAYYERKYPVQWIFEELQRVGVLDNQGFLTNTSFFSDVYNPNDFDVYMPDIRRINYDFKNDVIAEEMGRELLRCLMETSLSIHVTQEETTRYQSRKSGFVDSFLDQLGGNVLGKIFYKDSINTVKRKMTYSPNINVFTMFSSIEFGFSHAPYLNGALGNVIFYGKTNQRYAELMYGNHDEVRLYGVNVSLLNQKNTSEFWSKTVASSGLNLHVNQIRDQNNDDITWMSVRLKMGGYGLTNDYNMSIGLSNITSSLRGDSRLGIALGADGTYHVVPMLGIYGGFDTNFGLDFLSEDGELPWGLFQGRVGIQTAISSVRWRLGYEWLNGQSGTLFEGLTSSISFYF